MHLLTTSSATLDDLAEAVDLRQEPAEMLALSFTDSDLAGLSAAWKAVPDAPSLRLAALRDLRHPMSVDLWVEKVAAKASLIVVRLLGGYDWWRYGCERLAATARARGVQLALLPGECRDDDPRLAAASTLPREELDALLSFFREGGPDNMCALIGRMAALARGKASAARAVPVPKAGYYGPGQGIAADGLPPLQPASLQPKDGGAAVVPILFYRSMLLAADAAPIDALAEALAARGLTPVPIFVTSLKDSESAAFVEAAFAALSPAAIVTATAFAAGTDLFARTGVPVFQAIVATTRREAWAGGQRGLAPADLAMHVVLPELDGRILAGALSFKDAAPPDAELGFAGMANSPEPDRIEAVADRIAAHVRLARTSRAERRLAILMPDYPGAAGRTGYAVGLDVPSSVLAMLHDLKDAGYAVEGIPESPRALLDLLARESAGLMLEDYRRFAATLPAEARMAVEAAWGDAGEDATEVRLPMLSPSNGEIGSFNAGSPTTASTTSETALEGEMAGRPEGGRKGRSTRFFPFRAATFGNVNVALAPDRGRSADRRIDYHDPALPPRHALVAFGLWLQETLGVHALVHVGAHGTLEWLPGKAVALDRTSFPEIVTGPLPVVYPFIVSNPGEAAVAKRRIAAVTLGHLPPPLASAGGDEAVSKLERLVDEYAQADGLDRRRRERLAGLIVKTARDSGLAVAAGVTGEEEPNEALRRIDAWVCDVKDLAIKDGLHVYGRAPDDAETARAESAASEKAALLAALDGRHIVAGPSGAPARGRLDVLPTGRNLTSADPRTLPTPTAVDLGQAAADEVIRRYLQDHGDWPRTLVLDLWGSASLRTGGEEIAQGLWLMGCRPQWDAVTGRVTGVEVLPPAVLGRPRVDVTWRISGLFRDMFPAQIALIDAAVQAIAARDEAEADNPLAENARRDGGRPARIFGTSPGTYGAGIEEMLQRGDWSDRTEIGRAYLDAVSHAYGGADAEGEAAAGVFAGRVADADLLVHVGDDPGRDILEGTADVGFTGGFAAAATALGKDADLVMLDTTDPRRPRARTLTEAVTRIVRGRAVDPRFIAGQMRHGPRGAAEFLETVDRLVGFAETTGRVPGALIEALHEAYVADLKVRDFIREQNPVAARAMAERFMDARRRGLWHPLRNSTDADLAALLGEAGEEAA